MKAEDVNYSAFLGTCVDCGIRMTEFSVASNSEKRVIRLECEADDCDGVGRVRHEIGTDVTEYPEVQEGVENLRIGGVSWVDCQRCHGDGWVENGRCDLMGTRGRTEPCPECHTTGSVIGEVLEP